MAKLFGSVRRAGRRLPPAARVAAVVALGAVASFGVFQLDSDTRMIDEESAPRSGPTSTATVPNSTEPVPTTEITPTTTSPDQVAPAPAPGSPDSTIAAEPAVPLESDVPDDTVTGTPAAPLEPAPAPTITAVPAPPLTG